MAHLRALAALAGETLPGRVIRKFGEDRGSLHAIVVAWNLLFSIFPIALVTAGGLGLVLRDVSPLDIYDKVVALFPDRQSQAAALDALKGVREQSGVFLVIGVAGLLWGGSLLFGAMDESFSFIYQVPPRDFFRQRLMSLGMMSIYTVLTGVALGLSTVVALLKDVPGVGGVAGYKPLGVALVAVTGVVLFAAMYLIVPNLRLRLRDVMPGAGLAGVAFAALTVLFPRFVALDSGLNRYGQSFTLLFVLLTYFYFVGTITVLGVELNSILRAIPVRRAFAFAPAGSAPPETGKAPAADARPAPWTGVDLQRDGPNVMAPGEPRPSRR